MASLQQRHHRWDAKVRVPKPLRDRHGGREWLYLRLQSNNRRAAEIEAREWENGLRAEWARDLGHDTAATETVRQRRRAEYVAVREGALAGEFDAYTPGEEAKSGRTKALPTFRSRTPRHLRGTAKFPFILSWSGLRTAPRRLGMVAFGRPSILRVPVRRPGPTRAVSSPASSSQRASAPEPRRSTRSARTSLARWSGRKCVRMNGRRCSAMRRVSPTVAITRTA